MKNLLKVVLLVVLIAGCGGGGGGSSDGGGTSNITNSPFAGVYNGTFQFSGGDGDSSGTLTVNIKSNASFTFTTHNNTTYTNATGTGSINSSGEANGTFIEEGETSTFDGTVTKYNTGRLTGSLNLYYGGNFVGIITFDVLPQSGNSSISTTSSTYTTTSINAPVCGTGTHYNSSTGACEANTTSVSTTSSSTSSIRTTTTTTSILYDTGGSYVIWRVTDMCPDFLIVGYRFYDETYGGYWPGGSGNFFYTEYYNTTYETKLVCTPGAYICLGAASTDGKYWGVGLDGSESCTGCCHYCDEGTYYSDLTCD